MEELNHPPTLFVDSSAFIALADRSEDRHREALAFAATLSTGMRLVTSNFILDESVTRVRTLLGVEAAYQLGKEILSSGRYELITIDAKIGSMALEKMRKFADKTFSFTDCTSFVLMETKGIRDVFAFDEDFRRAGFQIHPHPHPHPHPTKS